MHTVARLGRSVSEAVRSTALENASNLILLGWPGHTGSSGLLFGQVIDPLVDDPPTDVAVVRCRSWRPLHRILVPVAGGPNSRLAVKMAAGMAMVGDNGPVTITLLHVVLPGATDADRIRARQVSDEVCSGLPLAGLGCRLVEGAGVVDTVLARAEDCDLLVLGGSEEAMFRNLLLGNVAVQIAQRAAVTVITVKRRSSRLHSFLRQTVLEPSTKSASLPQMAPLDAISASGNQKEHPAGGA